MYMQTLHVGDRFTLSGNDTATRDVCSVLWVANPEETGFFIKVGAQGRSLGARVYGLGGLSGAWGVAKA